jgi:hypothetical protein
LLLAVDPVIRPTATQALEFEYLQDAEVLCDYSKHYLSRPPTELFDFESEKYSLVELRELIVGEVRLAASQNQILISKIGTPEDSNVISTRNSDMITSSTTGFDGTRAGVRQSRTASSSGIPTGSGPVPYRGVSATEIKAMQEMRTADSTATRRVMSSTAIVSDITAEEAQLAREQQMDTNPTQRYSLSRTMSNNAQKEMDLVKKAISSSSASQHPATYALRQSSLPPKGGTMTGSTSGQSNTRSHPTSLADARFGCFSGQVLNGHADSEEYKTQQQPELSTCGNVLNSKSRGPKTPSPKKMDIIFQKGARAKRVSLEGGVGIAGEDDEEREREAYFQHRATISKDRSGISSDIKSNNPFPPSETSTTTSNFLKARNFGFIRSGTSSTVGRSQPQKSQSSADPAISGSNQRNEGVPAPRLSSLLSQFSGRYQSLSSRAKSAASSSSTTTTADRLDHSSSTLNKSATSKPARASSAPSNNNSF